MNRLSFSILALAAIFLASAASAQPPAWDQAATTSIAKQLAADADAWRLALREQPDSGIGGGSVSNSFDAMLRKSETMRQMTVGLAAQLEKGDGAEKTTDVFRSLKEVVDDTAVDDELTFTDKPTLEAWHKVKGGVNKLAPYYGVKPSEP